MVPLAAAWRAGASEWTTAEREKFANVLASPQLWLTVSSAEQGALEDMLATC